MRFWRRGVADETAPDADTLPPEAAEVVTAEPAAAAAPVSETPREAEEPRGWFGRLRTGLSRSSARLNEGINTIFLRRRLDDTALGELEELLIASDMGLGVSAEVVEALRRTRFNQEVAPEEIRAALAEEVIRLVERVQRPLRIDPGKRPFVILVVGVNGSGKTKTIGKVTKEYHDAGRSVMLTAGILLIDTAGRLHNKADLMGELQKIVRVLKKVDATAPHAVLLVLDATVGQNAHAQAEIFREMVGVTGIVMTKLDGTAKGGVLVSLAEKYGIPIHAIGIGEGAEDLRPFEARAYARSLVGLDA
jgi:fused signal recognition particle receptor